MSLYTCRFGEIGDVFLPKVVSALVLERKKNVSNGPLLFVAAFCSSIYLSIYIYISIACVPLFFLSTTLESHVGLPLSVLLIRTKLRTL